MSEHLGAGPVRWMSLFIDVPAPDLEESAVFWTAVTGSEVGDPVGDDAEFLPLEPPDGDPCVWLQRTRDDTLACHPDLYVEDVEAHAQHAVTLGATVLSRQDGLVVLSSSGGLPFCLVRWRGQDRRPGPVAASGGLLDQLCLDVPPGTYDTECRFWADLTGWELYDDQPHDEFRRLRRPSHVPHALLLQRLDDEQAATSAHLDLSAIDRSDEVARHVALGASVVEPTEHWTVMRDPVGLTYCVTARRPGDV